MFTVKLARSGTAFTVEDGETILEAAERAAIVLSYSCRGGTCRSCMTQVLAGWVEHDPEYVDMLSIDRNEVAGGYRLLCSSFARSDVELDR
jgi:ferredoxin